ncbi:AGAP003731-PA-like protein [Anopheles sinensis]|uniref:AGAP003731-PA-like protein n=1 Tax=Anopheles sinensis TaxID=74873 RepID=A0A084VZX0_ANOSI|nr:AGAP003731-PA-like protein [Anopheles sinensis]
MYQALLQQAINSLQNLSSDELRNLLGDEEKLDERVNEVIKTIDSSKDAIINENRRLAEANLEFEPKMIELRSRVQELGEEGRQAGEVVKKKITELNAKASASNADTVMALLQTAAAESEEESEALVKQFLDGELSTDAFLEQFMGVRKLMHTRKLKAEKMVDLIVKTKGQNLDISTPMPGFHLLNLGQYTPPAPASPAGFDQPPSSSASPAFVPYPVDQSSIPYPLGMFQSPRF